jgi:hypothetical protein
MELIVARVGERNAQQDLSSEWQALSCSSMPPKTGKEALLEWCQQKTAGYSGVNIVNFHTSWRDGLGFCALLHYFAPEDVDYEKLKAEPAVLKRLEAIFDIGDDLGVANILDPEDMLIEPHPDQFSVITYLSQVFHRFKGQPRGGQQAAAKRPAELDASALRLAQQACHVCNALLTGDVIEAFGRTVHTRCFTCASCNVRLGRQFVDVDDKPYCDVCGKAAFVASVAAKQNLALAAGAALAGGHDDKAALDRQLADEQRRIADREAAATARLNEQRDALRKREADERAKFAQAEQIVTNKMKEQRDALAAKKRERLETLGHSDAPRLQSLRKPKMGGRRAPTPGVRPGAKLDTHVDAPSSREAADDASPPAAAAAATSAPSGGAPRGVIKPGGMPGNQGALAAAAASMAGSLRRGGGAAGGGGGGGRGAGPSAQQRQAEAAKAAADERAKLEAQKRRELEAARALRESKAAAELAERDAKAKLELQRVAAEAKAESERQAAARAREAAAREAEREARELAQQISKSTEDRKRELEQKRKLAEEERAREQAAAKRREEEAIAARRAELERQQREEGERRRREEATLRAQEEERMKRDLDAAASRISQLFLELGDDVAGTSTAAAAAAVAVPEPVNDDDLAGVRQADGTILLSSGVILPALPGAGTKVRALFDYPQAQDAGELTFRRGDVVVVIERGDDGAWWSGMLGETVGLFPSNFFSSRGRRICGPGDEEMNSDDEDDSDDGNTDEFEREERMLEELERKKLGELAAERTRRKEEILKAELAAERAAEEERGRLAREREQLINRMQDDWAEKKRTRTRTQTDANMGALDDKSKAAIDAQYSAKVAAAATRAAALEAGGKDGHVRTMTLSTTTSAADGSAAAITIDALLQGFLNKRDGRGFGTIKKWRKRYYVLRDGQMIAYPDKPTKGMAPTGVIALEFVEKIEPSGRDAFVIHTSEKKYHLDALGDVAVATKWVETLEAAVNAAKNPPSTRGGGAAGASSAVPEVDGAAAATWQRKSGWLEKHGGGAFQAQWSKVWVVMKGGVVFTFNKPGAKQQQKVSLYRAVLDEYKPHKYDGVTFMITTQNESDKKGKPSEIIFRCKNQQEMHDWLNTLLRQKLKIEESVDMIAL